MIIDKIGDEVRVWRTLTWPFIKQEARKDLRRVKWYYLGFVPPALLGRSLERELRRDMDKGTRP
jgi:hypothetical protein